MKSYVLRLSVEEQKKLRQVLSALKVKDLEAYAKYCLQRDWMHFD